MASTMRELAALISDFVDSIPGYESQIYKEHTVYDGPTAGQEHKVWLIAGSFEGTPVAIEITDDEGYMRESLGDEFDFDEEDDDDDDDDNDE